MAEAIKHYSPPNVSRRGPVAGCAQESNCDSRVLPSGGIRGRAGAWTHGGYGSATTPAPPTPTPTRSITGVQACYRTTSLCSKAPPNLTKSVRSADFYSHPTVGQQRRKRARKNAVNVVTVASSVEGHFEAKTVRPPNMVNTTTAQNGARKELAVFPRTPSAFFAKEARTRKKNWRPHCKQQSCLRPASYAWSNEIIPVFCEKHKLDGMQNVVHPNRGDCLHEGCARVSSYASTSDTLANFCHLHKKKGMVKVRDKIGTRCEEVTCVKQASFAMECQRYPRFCKNHKQQGMVNIRNHRCLALGCSKGATFAVVGDRRGIYCGDHKLAGMVNTRQRVQGVFLDHARISEKSAVAATAVRGGTLSVFRDKRTPGFQPHLCPSLSVDRNAADASLSPSPSSSSPPTPVIAAPGEFGSTRFPRGAELEPPRAQKGGEFESPRVQGGIRPGPSSSSSPPSKLEQPEGFGKPRFQPKIEFGSPRAQQRTIVRRVCEKGGVPLGSSIERRRASTGSELVPEMVRSGSGLVPPRVQPRTRTWNRTMKNEGPQKMVDISDQQRPKARMRVPDDNTYGEDVRTLVGAPGERFLFTDNETSDAVIRSDSTAATPPSSEADSQSDNRAVGFRLSSDTDTHSDAGAVGYRQPTNTDTHCDAEAVEHHSLDADAHSSTRVAEYRRWSMPPQICTMTKRCSSGFSNPDGRCCGNPPTHPASRTSDDKHCGGGPMYPFNRASDGENCCSQPTQPLNRGASRTFATGTVVRVETQAGVVAEESRPTAKTLVDSHRETRAIYHRPSNVDDRKESRDACYRRPTDADTRSDAGAVGKSALNDDAYSGTEIAGYHRRGMPPKTSTRTTIERNTSVLVNSDHKRCSGQWAHTANRASDGERCNGQRIRLGNQASGGERCKNQPDRPCNRGAIGSVATGTAVDAGRVVEVVEENPPSATGTSSKELGEQTRSSMNSHVHSPQFLECTTDRAAGVRVSCPRFRVPNACSFDDPQSAFPDTRRDTRQPRTSGGVSCVYDVPSGEGDVARPLEEPSIPAESDAPRERGTGQLPVQEPTAVGKKGSLEDGQLPGHAKTPFYFNLVKALTSRERGTCQLPVQKSSAVGKRGSLKDSQLPGYAKTPFYFNLVNALTKNAKGPQQHALTSIAPLKE